MRYYAAFVMLLLLAALAACAAWSWRSTGVIHHCLIWQGGTVTFGTAILSVLAWLGVLSVLSLIGRGLLELGEGFRRGWLNRTSRRAA